MWAENELIIADAEYEKAAEDFKRFFELIKEVILQYKTIFSSVSNTAISSGATHDAIVRYLEYVEQLETIVKDTGAKFASLTDSFIREIELEDDFLYDANIADSVRDFSSDEEKRLMDCLKDPWTSVTDNLGDKVFGKIWDLVEALNWNGVKSFLQSCHGLLLDYNDVTKDRLNEIFMSVRTTDRDYGRTIPGATMYDGDYYTCKFDHVSITMILIRNILDIMAEIIKPENGAFTVANIDDKLGNAYRELMQYYGEMISIVELGARPTIPAISDFVSQPWAELYFAPFSSLIVDFVLELGGYDALKIYVFNMFEVAEDRVKYGDNYQKEKIKQQLLSVLEDMTKTENYKDTEYKEEIKVCSDYLKYVKKYGADKVYEYLHTHRYEESGRLLLDGRTREGKAFKKFLDSLKGAQDILKYGDKAAEFVFRLFTNYSAASEILDSFADNYAGDDTVVSAAAEIQALYDKEFDAWMKTAILEVKEIGIEAVTEKLTEMVPAFDIVNNIKKGIDFVGEATGWGVEAKAMYNVMVCFDLNTSSGEAYKNALTKFRNADPESPNYNDLAKDVENCFNLYRKNLEEAIESMEKASDGTKKSYYSYCLKQVKKLSMNDDASPELMSYDDYVSLICA